MGKIRNIDLKQIFGESVEELTEDQAKVVVGKITEIVESRVAALEFDLKEQIEAEARMKYETQLTEKTAELDSKLQEAESYVIEKAESFKSEIIEKSRKEVETIRTQADNEVATAKAQSEKAIAEAKEESVKAIASFKEEIVSKVDDYLDLELKNTIPQDVTEAMAKLSIYEPIVESIRGAFSQNYIRIDEESFGLLKDAKGEIMKLQEELKNVTKEAMQYKSSVVNFKRSEAISNVCEGLTESQYERASKLLEGYDPEVIPAKFKQIRDIILERRDDKVEEEYTRSGARSTNSADNQVVEDVITEDYDLDVDVITEDAEEVYFDPKAAEIQAHAKTFKEMFQ